MAIACLNVWVTTDNTKVFGKTVPATDAAAVDLARIAFKNITNKDPDLSIAGMDDVRNCLQTYALDGETEVVPLSVGGAVATPR